MAKALLLGLLSLLGSCAMFELGPEPDEARHPLILLPGHVQRAPTAAPLLVALLDRQQAVLGYRSAAAGEDFYFVKPAADYQLLAFADHNGNRRLDADEPRQWLRPARASALVGQSTPALATRLGKLNRIRLAATDLAPAPSIDLDLQRRAPELHDNYLRVTGFADPRFSPERARQGFWQPLRFVEQVGYGLYLLHPWDERKEPVFLVHGINASPRAWAALAASFDPRRFQLVLFHYPSGVPLDNSAYLLSEAIRDLQQRHPVQRYHLVAHSMGGLLARRSLQLLDEAGAAKRLCLFISLSTPWGGHAAAAKGVAHAPVVAPVWRDLAPGSDYLEQLFAQGLPASSRHHMLVSYGGGRRLRPKPNDGVVSLASQLRSAAQDQAQRLYLLEESHTGILRSPRARTLLQQLFDGLANGGCQP